MIDIGIDESQSGPILILSAIVGNTGMLSKLNAEWKRELVQAGVDYFHATEHWNGRSKAYHGLGSIERDALLDRLICHLQSRFMFGATVVIDEAEYKSVSSERMRSQYGSAYGFGFQNLMMLVLLELTKLKKQNQPVNILIEQGHRNCGQAIGFIRHKKQLNSAKGLRIGNFGVGDKREYPLLQAADLIAFGMCEFEVKGESDFAARAVPRKYRNRFLTLPWSRSAVDALKEDIERHANLLKSGASGAKRRTELVMW